MRDYERIVRTLVEQGHEGPKVDFKEALDFENKRTIAELARLASAMANTDSDELDDLGFIIIGATRRALVGGRPEFGKDSFCASLATRLNVYIDPEARLEIKGFEDTRVGWFGCVVVKPSRAVRPHFMAKEFSDEKRVVCRKNECYVRRSESVELASRADFERMYQQRFGAELDRLLDRADPAPAPDVLWATDPLSDSVTVPPSGPVESADSGVEMFSEEEIAKLPESQRRTARRHNEKVAEYRAAVAVHSEALAEWRGFAANGQVLRVAIRNLGEAPLESATVYLTFPDGFRVYAEREVPPEPKVPPLPRKPKLALPGFAAFEMMNRLTSAYAIGGFRESSPLMPVMPDVNFSGLDRAGPLRVEGWVRKVSHSFSETLPRAVFVIPPSQAGTYTVGAELHADNLRRSHRGTLTIRVEAGAPRVWQRKSKSE